MRAVCGEPGCDKPVHGKGLCSTHYERTRRKPGKCRDCGGPKPPGIGRRLCDDCRAKAEERRREERVEYDREWYQRNREDVLARERERYEDPAFRERKKQASRDWAAAHPDRARTNARRGWAKRKYGLTLEEVEEILARGCAICGTHRGRKVGKTSAIMGEQAEQRICLDHCHTTGKVRDALCHNCNSMLGLAADDPDRLRAAADYLERHR